MPIINLRSQYPHLSEDIFMEISDPIFEVYDHSRKQINNYDRRGALPSCILLTGRWRRHRNSCRFTRAVAGGAMDAETGEGTASGGT